MANPYAPSQSPVLPPDDIRPSVVVWFKVYTAFLAAIYLLCTVAGIAILATNPTDPDMDPMEIKFMGWAFVIVSLPFVAVCLLPFFVGRRPWVWVYDLVLICLGMTSCFVVVCIPLLIFWLKPETQRYFGKKVT